MARILVVDDEAMIRALVADTVEAAGHECLAAADITGGLELAGQGVDLVFLDVLLPDGDGLDQVRAFAGMPGQPEVIVITGHGDADAAEQALKSGAWDYLVKPLRVRALADTLEQTLQWRESRKRLSPEFHRGSLIGDSRALRDALSELQKAAASMVPVLLLGETGVGKELFAAALHANSPRHDGPFVTVDCTSLPETLVEAQLFGHARGAFTGADRAREGLMTTADHGTLFLDEIGELPLAVQGTFLRAVELRRYRPVGDVREVSSDFRLVAATNRELSDMERMGLFRRDLHYRLRGMTIAIPPLRERREDIPLLAEHFVGQYCRVHGLGCKELTSGLTEMLMEYRWPGNVRELRHAMERACAVSGEGDQLFGRHLPAEVRIALARSRSASEDGDPGAAHRAPAAIPAGAAEGMSGAEVPLPSLKEARFAAERTYLDRLLAESGGSMPRAVALSGVSRGHLYALLQKHGLDIR